MAPGPGMPSSWRPASRFRLLPCPGQRHPLRVVQELLDLRLAVTTMTAERPDRVELALLCPAGDGLRVYPEQRRHLRGGQQPVFGTDIWPHDVSVLSRAGEPAQVTESDTAASRCSHKAMRNDIGPPRALRIRPDAPPHTRRLRRLRKLDAIRGATVYLRHVTSGRVTRRQRGGVSASRRWSSRPAPRAA